MSSSSQENRESEYDFVFDSTEESNENKGTGSSEPQVETETNSHTGVPPVQEGERMADIRDLKGVSSFEAIAYHLYINNHHSEVLREVSKVMNAYTDFEGKALNIKEVTALIDSIEQMEQVGLSKEEARDLQEQSYLVTNNLAQKIKIFMSQKSTTHAIVGVKSKVILHTDCPDLARFLEAELVKEYTLGQNREYVSSWVNMCKDTLAKHKAQPNKTFLNRMRNSSSPLNQYMLAGEMVEFEEEIRQVCVSMSPEDKVGITTKVHMSTKVLTERDSETVSAIAPQIVKAFMGSIQRENKKRQVVQVEYGVEKFHIPMVSDDILTWKITKEGAGSEEFFNPLAMVEPEEEDRLVATHKGLGRVLSKLKTRGFIMTPEKIFIKTQWTTRMNNDVVARMDTMGYVHASLFSTLYARLSKGKAFVGVHPQEVLDAYIFLLLDPLSRMILAIPRKFVRKDSQALTKDPEIGMIIRKGLLKVLHLYTSAFSLGVLACPDWDALDPQLIKESRLSFRRAKGAIDETRYGNFVDIMTKTLNSFHPVAVIVSGSKQDTDPDVTKYFADQDWEMEDDVPDADYDDEFVEEELEF